MTYQDCCTRLGEKLSQSGAHVAAEAMTLLEACVDALRANSADGRLDQIALVEHLPKLRYAIRTVWNHDRILAVTLENRIIQILDDERARSVAAVEEQANDDET